MDDPDKPATRLAVAAHEAAGRALREPVTGLPNRELFEDRLMVGISLAKRHEWLLAVMSITLDGFRAFSERHGADVSDRALHALGARLFMRARGGDTISSSGDDRLLYVLVNPGSRENIRRVAQRVRDRLLLPVEVDSHILQITPRIGIAVYPDDGIAGASLVGNALSAMHDTRASDLTYMFYESRMTMQATATSTQEPLNFSEARDETER